MNLIVTDNAYTLNDRRIIRSLLMNILTETAVHFLDDHIDTGQQFSDTFTLLKESGLMLIKVMGGTSGVIFGTMFIGGLSAVKDKDPITVQDFAEYIDLGTKAISVRGKVDRGAKTMYDALAEARDSLLKAAEENADVHAFFLAGAEGAERGAEATKPMQSRMGRSKNFRDRTVGHPDSGAVSTSLIFKAFADYFA